ncbi:type II toxin-antitoxin system VapB family antitoxin [Nonomuraea angiospora]|uniref:Arc/MetJ family transcription regulator n=2 Tax=Nonomuraea TaxID=83681 RepID=A0A7W9LAX4_9ACTN|nr:MULTISPECIES: type II toxin-antitoxin system VapB family antitoxin [Nonomuraea]MBB5777162.1 Arc/MetJ family transcription regulator [Nonomuraea jabiensis]MBE1590082.1 Arc/MetJ family transcription regulator [Nonomuraea angiospora]MDX3110569.1 type II toxin-antitoxin system VapB family antitoxin [Nonomuraea angiospora]
MRTVIDIDKELLEVAQHELGTSTMKETVNAALEEIAERAKRREAFEYWRTRDNSDLLDPEIMKHAW